MAVALSLASSAEKEEEVDGALSASAAAEEARAEARRYCNRSAILERAAREKAKELYVSERRVVVLTEAAVRLRERAEAEKAMRIREGEAREREKEREAGAKAEAVEGFMASFSEAEKLRAEAEREAEDVEKRHVQYVERLSSVMESAKTELLSERSERRRDGIESERSRADLKERLDVTEKKVILLREELKGTESDMADAETLIQARDDYFRSSRVEERRKKELVEEKLAAAVSDLGEVRSELAKALMDVEDLRNATAALEVQNESMEEDEEEDERIAIADAAVLAAERRENATAVILEKVRMELKSSLKERDDAELRLRKAKDERDSVLDRLGALTFGSMAPNYTLSGDAGRNDDNVFSERLTRAEEALSSFESELIKVRYERDQACRSLSEERRRSAAERRQENDRRSKQVWPGAGTIVNRTSSLLSRSKEDASGEEIVDAGVPKEEEEVPGSGGSTSQSGGEGVGREQEEGSRFWGKLLQSPRSWFTRRRRRRRRPSSTGSSSST